MLTIRLLLAVTQLATAMNTYNAECKDLHDIILATMLQFLQQTSWNIKKYNALQVTFESVLFADQQKSRTKKRLYSVLSAFLSRNHVDSLHKKYILA